jgi:hypothetical protein
MAAIRAYLGQRYTLLNVLVLQGSQRHADEAEGVAALLRALDALQARAVVPLDIDGVRRLADRLEAQTLDVELGISRTTAIEAVAIIRALVARLDDRHQPPPA